MFRALSYFTDLQDGGHPYEKGDAYPRSGYAPSMSRINELLGNGNVRGVPVIELVEDKKDVVTKEKKTIRTRKKKNAN